MEEKLKGLFNECLGELNSIGINVYDDSIGEIDIKLSKRNAKRYGCCKQEEPDKSSIYYEKIGKRKYIRYSRYKKHVIEISKWVMNLDDSIIKNTIIHEIIHCFPNCSNHGEYFKKYAKYINENLGYKISRLGNKKEDFEKSNISYDESIKYKYKILCDGCGQSFYRQRIIKNFKLKYRCGKCGGKFIIYDV